LAEAPTLTRAHVEDAARAGLEAFRSRVAAIPYEAKGILYSEMFFFYLCARAVGARRIVESGRARGQSTLVLARCFPELPVISVEYDAHSPDAAVALARLKGLDNLELRFGDATRLLPRIVQRGDAVIIDGPKGYRGLRLALRLLAQGHVAAVFLHDIGRGSAQRRFLQARLPRALYSDDPGFARLAHVLDAAVRETIPLEQRWREPDAPAGYGYTLACLQRSSEASYWRAWLAAVLDGVLQRAGR
jgi:predicted O-methyltransferase YrrM